MRKFLRFISGVTASVVMAALGVTLYYQQELPDNFYLYRGQNLDIQSTFDIQTSSHTQISKSLPAMNAGDGQTVDLKLFGVLPIKQANVQVLEETELIPCGTPFGIKMFTEGVMVVGLNNIDSEEGFKNPAKEAGIKIGDVIVSVDGNAVTSNKQISQAVESCQNGSITVDYTRDGQPGSVSISPIKSRVDGKNKVGIWVRDSSAGIGTITFYNPATGMFGGLGHAVCDVDTGQILPLSSGEIVGATINGVHKGVVGNPGELIGAFTSKEAIGSLLGNTDSGVFGEMYSFQQTAKPIKMALKQEVTTGKATIYTTINGTQPEEFEIEIDKIDLNEQTTTKNMVIRVTDQRLLEAAGGIVQGMSGSPILQNGKLVGAVTHVFVNDPTKGYGIFAENMLSVSNEMCLDKAS
jgi:stage IV sporulation protein B